MGYRAHVCTTYTVEYGDGFLNQCCEELSQFLNSYTFTDPKTGTLRKLVEWEDAERENIEISREGLRRLIWDIENNPESLQPLPEKLAEMSEYENLLGVLSLWLDTADPDHEYIRIEWY